MMSKERLEEIKTVENWGGLNKWQFKTVARLIEQAERAEKLQDQIDNKILPEIEKGWTENIRFRQALEDIRDISTGAIHAFAVKALESEE